MEPSFFPMIRVGDLDRSIAFYGRLGLAEKRRMDVPQEKFTLAYLGWGGGDGSTALGLTYNYGVRSYEHGTAFGQLVLHVPDVVGLCNALRAAGVNIKREPGPVKFGTTLIAFVEDPDGYKVELVQQGQAI